MSSRTRQGRSHLNQKAKRQGGKLDIFDFTEWLNLKGAMMGRRHVYAGGRKSQKVAFFGLFGPRRRGNKR